MIRAFIIVLALLVPVGASAADLYAIYGQQATLAANPVPNGTINIFTLNGAPTALTLTISGTPVDSAKACRVTLLDSRSGFHLIGCTLGAPLTAGQIVGRGSGWTDADVPGDVRGV